MENSTHCKILTPENFILKLGTRDYLDDNTYYTIFDVDRFTGVSPQIGEILPICDFFPLLSFFSRSNAQLEPRGRYSRFMAQMTWFSPRTAFRVTTTSDVIWGNCALNTHRNGA